MTILLTGGAGFVGLNIAEAALRAGHGVALLDRAPPPPEAMAELQRIGPEITYHAGDVTRREELDRLFDAHDIDRVVQGAAITADATREREAAGRIVEVNLLGTVEVLDAARRHGVERLLYLSSSSVYGENSFADAALDEARTIPLPDSLYAITKYAGERTALRLRTLHGLDIVAARLSAVFGPWERDTGVRDTLSPIFQATMAARAGEEVILPRACVRDWVYARDVGAAALALLTAPDPLRHTVYNIAPGTTWTVADWCQRLAAHDPKFRWRIGQECPTVDLHGDRDRSPLAIDRITADTDWRPAFGLDHAFTDYMNWMTQEFDRN